ncbi:glycoside hydrolase superfamily [Nemania sp. FL0916]|nr:glycoside hydrolase superfamily [Nemania sp. FL0916]
MKSISAVLLGLLSAKLSSAAYKPTSSNNIAVYWGQNSAGGNNTQRPLVDVCQSEKDVDIILLSFLIGATDIDKALNFASSDRPTEQDITDCQTKYNKTLILSLGGAATDNTFAFAAEDKAVDAATRIWASFGPSSAAAMRRDASSTFRPFGSAAVDGFDLDFEAPYSNVQVFAQQLRKLMDLEKSRKFYLSAAPQCPFPDASLGPVLQGDMATVLDFAFIQFYNNPPCEVRTPDSFMKSLEQWDAEWAKPSGAKIFVGVPGAVSAASASSYVEGSVLAAGPIRTAQKVPSFAGVMVWDMSQLDANKAFLPPIVNTLSGSSFNGSTDGTPSGNSTQAYRLIQRRRR